MNGFEEFVCWVDKDGLVLAVNPGCVENRGPYTSCYVFILPAGLDLVGDDVLNLQGTESKCHENSNWQQAWGYFNTAA